MNRQGSAWPQCAVSLAPGWGPRCADDVMLGSTEPAVVNHSHHQQYKPTCPWCWQCVNQRCRAAGCALALRRSPSEADDHPTRFEKERSCDPDLSVRSVMPFLGLRGPQMS